jgi:plasmid stabilization system protein ParE
MAHQVKWTKRASLDLAGIKAYIEADRSAAAGREIGDILRKVDLLEAFPQIGPIFRLVDDIEHRAVLAGKYRIIYILCCSTKWCISCYECVYRYFKYKL